MILAVLFKVPVVFIVENNQYAMSFPADKWTSSEQIAARGETYGMPGVATDGNDLMAVRKVVQQAVDRARAGKGPALVVNDTYRWRGHSKSDRNRYRTQEEIDEWKEKDPIQKFAAYCLKKKLLTEEEIEEIKEQGYADIESCPGVCGSQPRAGCQHPDGRGVRTMREITYLEAVREAMVQEMERDETVFLIGEDIGEYGGAFQVSLWDAGAVWPGTDPGYPDH